MWELASRVQDGRAACARSPFGRVLGDDTRAETCVRAQASQICFQHISPRRDGEMEKGSEQLTKSSSWGSLRSLGRSSSGGSRGSLPRCVRVPGAGTHAVFSSPRRVFHSPPAAAPCCADPTRGLTSSTHRGTSAPSRSCQVAAVCACAALNRQNQHRPGAVRRQQLYMRAYSAASPKIS